MNNPNPNGSNELLSDLTFCVIDLETTGGNLERDQIIEIGIVKIHRLKIVDQLSYVVRPTIEVPIFVQKLTSLTPDKLALGHAIEDVLQSITDFVGDAILVAHNSAFDIPFLNAILQRHHHAPLNNHTLCTNLLTKNLIPDLLNSNLPYLCELFGIEHQKAHRALEDALATGHLLLTFLAIFIQKGITKINHIYYPRKKFELDTLYYHRDELPQSWPEIFETLPLPALLTFKKGEGHFVDVLATKNLATEYTHLLPTLAKSDWNLLTIKFYGNYLQILAQLNRALKKFSRAEQQRVLASLRRYTLEHVGTDSIPEATASDYFVIGHHLIKQQYLITAMNQYTRNELVYRYPLHKKKLEQFLRNAISRPARPYHINQLHPELKTLIHDYLNTLSALERKNYLFIDFKTYRDSKERFFRELRRFIEEERHLIDYPLEYPQG